jgi:hypothetical protein
MTQPTCIDCHASPPETRTQYTLISSHGWRVVRTHHSDGQVALQWRCASCWKAFKASRPAAEPEMRGASWRPPRPSAPDPAEAKAGDMFDRAREALTKPPTRRPK